MRRNDRRKYRIAGVLFICLLLAGTCYAKWRKELKIQADIRSGEWNYRLSEKKEDYKTGWKDTQDIAGMQIGEVLTDTGEDDRIHLQMTEVSQDTLLSSLCAGKQLMLTYPVLGQETNTCGRFTCDTAPQQISLHCSRAVVKSGSQQYELTGEQYAPLAPDLVLVVDTSMSEDEPDQISQTFTLTPESSTQWAQALQQKLPEEYNEVAGGQPLELQLQYELEWNLSLQQADAAEKAGILSCTYAYWTHTFTLMGDWMISRKAEVMPTEAIAPDEAVCSTEQE